MRWSGRLGEQRFVLIFSLFAAASFTALALTFGLYHDQGLPGLALGRWPLVRAGLVAVGFAGALIMVLGVLSYFHSPMAIFRTELRPPLGIERITRHAFFVGTVLLMGAPARSAWRRPKAAPRAWLPRRAASDPIHPR
jgi:hypothetical protein